MLKKLVLLVSVLFLLDGCVARTIRTSAVSYNLSLEDSENETLLLNVIRSDERRPMYLSTISKVTGSTKAEGTLSAMVPFAQYGRAMTGAMTGLFSATPGSTFNLNPTFDVTPLNTQEFMTGFLTPVDKKTLAYFYGQGWAPGLLLNMLVTRVVKDDGTTILNQPGSAAFKTWVDAFVNKAYEVKTVKSCQKVGPLLTEKQLGQLSDLVAAIDDGLTVHELKDGEGKPSGKFQTLRITDDLQFVAPAQAAPAQAAPAQAAPAQIAPAQAAPQSTPGQAKPDPLDHCDEESVGVEATTVAGGVKVANDATAKPTETLILRSPEAIVYYLGELTRYFETVSHPLVKAIMHKGSSEETVFVARAASKMEGCSKGDVTVNYGEKRYIVPEAHQVSRQPTDICPDPGRSMQALSLISELIALQKSAKNLQTTSVVRVVGQ
ncbi:MAG TPA: hypothetical protein VHG32_23145 [Thermoanaerobaculia bacterium]|jgi:hypothetical protein|nr:hypothetical protein [Thermoanaerobaculia bacterium]